MTAALAALWRRRAMRTCAWGLVAIAAPLLARLHLRHRLDSDLEPALSRALDVPVTVGSLDATLTGLVELHDVAAGSTMSADTVEAAFDPFAIAAGDLEPAEIRIESPHIRLAGDPVWRRLRHRLEAGADVRRDSRSPARSRHLVVTGGVLVLELPMGLTVRASGVEVRPHRDGARIVAGPVEIEWRSAPLLEAHARFTRAAADIGQGGWRLLAVTGTVAIGRSGQRPLVLASSTLAGGVDGTPGELHLRGRVGGDDPGRLDVVVPVDASRARVEMDSIPLGFLEPIVGSWAVLEAARASGHVEVERDGGQLRAAARVAIDGVLLSHPFISSEPVAVDGSLAGRAQLRRVAGRRLLAIDDLELQRAGVTIGAHGLMEWSSAARMHPMPERAQLEVVMPAIACDQAFAAVPEGLRGRLAGFAVDGTVDGRLGLAFDRSSPGGTDLEMALNLDHCRVAGEPALADPGRLAAPFDLQLPDGSVIRVGDGPDHVTLGRLPRHVVGAFVAAEDARFFHHGGFDAEQIERSLGIDLDSGRLLRGGSTISQQLVKNVYLSPERTLARKLQEAVLTWRVEARVNKRVILERYLDLIELGTDIHGIGPAARYWFATSPEKLRVRQAAFLAALTPAPQTLSRSVRDHGGIDREIAERVDVVLRAMRVSGVIDRSTYERAQSEPLHLAPAALGRR